MLNCVKWYTVGEKQSRQVTLAGDATNCSMPSSINGTNVVYLRIVLKNRSKYQQTILIVDDEEELCLVLSYALRKIGYQVEYSLNIEDAKKKLNKLTPDIVLLDINLPDGSGLYMVPEIKELKSSFLVISAYEDKKSQAMAAGAADFVKKPFTLKAITTSIQDTIEHRKK